MFFHIRVWFQIGSRLKHVHISQVRTASSVSTEPQRLSEIRNAQTEDFDWQWNETGT